MAVLKVVAARIMVSLTPADRELSRMSKAVTPAIAVARKKVRRMLKQAAKGDAEIERNPILIIRLHGLARAHPMASRPG